MSEVSDNLSDQELIAAAQVHFKEERLLAAGRCLRRVQDQSLLSDDDRRSLKNIEVCERAIAELVAPPSTEGAWKKQGETHGHYNTSIYYKVEEGAKMTCRMETPIPSTLLVPLLSVLNESSLYESWIPSWSTPVRLGMKSSEKLLQHSRGRQIIRVLSQVPWPLSTREVMIDALALDDIDEQGLVAIKLRTPNDPALLPEGFVDPGPGKYDRVDFDGGILIRSCSTDHPNFADATKKWGKPGTENGDLLLVQFTLYFDAHMAMVPHTVINFVTRTVVGRIWSMFLQVAEEVRDGSRPAHKKLIDEKPEFYKWMNERIDVLLHKLSKPQFPITDAGSCSKEASKAETSDMVAGVTASLPAVSIGETAAVTS